MLKIEKLYLELINKTPVEEIEKLLKQAKFAWDIRINVGHLDFDDRHEVIKMFEEWLKFRKESDANSRY